MTDLKPSSARKHHKDKAIEAWNRRKYEKQ